MRQPASAGLAALLIVLSTTGITRAVVHNEATDGELSSSRTTPTSLGTFGPGTHSVIATSGSADQDNFTFTIPAGASLMSIIPISYSATDISFIGIASGSSLPASTADPSGLLGYTHFGPGIGAENMGLNILPAMGVGPGAIGFTPPLGPGTYSVWMQQTNAPVTFQMDFVVPEPGGAWILALLGACLVRRARGGGERMPARFS